MNLIEDVLCFHIKFLNKNILHTCLIFLDDYFDLYIFSCSSSDKTVKIWNAGSRQCVHTFYDHSDQVSIRQREAAPPRKGGVGEGEITQRVGGGGSIWLKRIDVYKLYHV